MSNSDEKTNKNTDVQTKTNLLCNHDTPLKNVTLVGGIKSGNFTSHGTVDTFDECLSHCCQDEGCDVAFMVKQTCFALKCASDKLCQTRQAKPSPYNPTVGFVRRNNKPTIKGESLN